MALEEGLSALATIQEKLWLRTAIVTAIVGSTATWFLSDWVTANRQEAERANFVRLADVLEIAFNERVASIERGLVQSAEMVRRATLSLEDWQRYVASSRFTDDLPGVVTVGLIDGVRGRDLPVWTTNWNSGSAPLRLLPAVRNSAPDVQHLLVRTFEPPLSGSKAYRGYNLGSDPAFSEVLLQSAGTGRSAMLPRISFSDDRDSPRYYVFIQPVAGSRGNASSSASRGSSWVFSAIDPQRFLGSLIRSDAVRRILGNARVEVYEGDEPVREALLFSSGRGGMASFDTSPMTRQMPLTVGGQIWLARLMLVGPGASTAGIDRKAMLAGGFVLTLLATALFVMLSGTRRRALEHAMRLTSTLAASEARFRTLSASAPIGIFMVDFAGRVVWANQRFIDSSNITPERFTEGVEWWQVASAYERDRIANLWNASSSERIHCEATFQTTSSLTKWAAAKLVPVRNAAGEPAGFVGTLEDVTLAKEQSTLSEREHNQLLSIIQNAPVAMAMLDADLKYLGASSRWTEDFRLPAHAYVGHAFSEALPTEYRQFGIFVQGAMARGEEVQKGEEEFVLPSGEKVFKRIAIHPWSTASGDRKGVVICAFNITELVSARQLAEDHAKFRAEFLAHMSHELRNPLTSIVGGVGLLEDTKLDAEQKEMLSSLSAAGSLMLSIADDVLDLSKIEARRLELETVPLVPREVSAQAAAIMLPRAKEKGIGILTEFVGGVDGRVLGDPTRLRQICVNLIANAIKFTQKGEVTIRMLVEDDGAQQKLRVEVRDTGIGMSREAQMRLFKKFSQAEASTARRFGGSGLGLSIVKELVDLMGGELGASSEENVGSVFWVEVKLARDSASESVSTTTTAA